jgi:hypothetical protein
VDRRALKSPIASSAVAWLGKGFVRFLLLMGAAAAVAAIAAGFGIAHDYSYLRASILTGSEKGQYYALANRLADRARRERGTLDVIATAGSIENVSRLTTGGRRCADMFALIQDGTPVPAEARLELLGRLPQPESLLLLGRQGHPFRKFSDLREASIGIGPDGSGTAYLMHQLFEDADLRELNAHLSNHELLDQAQLVAEAKLDLAAFVMEEDAEFLREVIRKYGLDVVSPQDMNAGPDCTSSMAQCRAHSGRPIRFGALHSGVRQADCTACNAPRRQPLRAAGRSCGHAHAGLRGASGVHSQQSSERHKLGHAGEAGAIGASVLSYGRTRAC